jgi:hypothetical protein
LWVQVVQLPVKAEPMSFIVDNGGAFYHEHLESIVVAALISLHYYMGNCQSRSPGSDHGDACPEMERRGFFHVEDGRS